MTSMHAGQRASIHSSSSSSKGFFPPVIGAAYLGQIIKRERSQTVQCIYELPRNIFKFFNVNYGKVCVGGVKDSSRQFSV